MSDKLGRTLVGAADAVNDFLAPYESMSRKHQGMLLGLLAAVAFSGMAGRVGWLATVRAWVALPYVARRFGDMTRD